MSALTQGPDLVLEQTSTQTLNQLVVLLQALLLEHKVTNFLLQEGLNVEKRDLREVRNQFISDSY